MKDRAILTACGKSYAAFALALAAMTSWPAAAAVRYVDDSAIGANNGSSWTNAYTDLQSALAVAKSGDEIRIAQGVYKPAPPNGDRTISFTLKPGVIVRGGYAGIGAPDPDARDVEKYVTTLSGDLNGNDFPSQIIGEDNSYHIVNAAEADQSTILEGVTITRGKANGPAGEYHNCGGGMTLYHNDPNGSNDYGGSPQVIACRFQQCEAASGGAAVFNRMGAPTFVDCAFKQVFSYESGALFHQESPESSSTFLNCTLTENSSVGEFAIYGLLRIAEGTSEILSSTFSGNEGGVWVGPGADNVLISDCTFSMNSLNSVHIVDSSPKISNCQFINNLVFTFPGSPPFVEFAATVLVEGPKANPTIENCLFQSNRRLGGSAIDPKGGIVGGAIVIVDSAASIVNCTFDDNTAGLGAPDERDGGGAMYIRGKFQVQVLNCSFHANGLSDTPRGGAVYLDSADTHFENCTFNDNIVSKSPKLGGAIYITGASTPTFVNCDFNSNKAVGGDGGGVFTNDSSPSFEGCTFTACQSNNGGAMAFDGGSATIDECQFAENIASGGAAITATGASTAPKFTNCSFNNHLSASGGAALFAHNAHPEFEACTFTNNVAWVAGGAMRCVNGAYVHANDCEFTNNQAKDFDGGAVAIESSNEYSVFRRCSFSDNMAANAAGAVHLLSSKAHFLMCEFLSNSAASQGAVLNQGPSLFTFVNCKFAGNTAAVGPAGAIGNNGGIMTVLGSAFTGNNGGSRSGAIETQQGGTSAILSCTFAMNTASLCGGVYFLQNAIGDLRNCAFFANNSQDAPLGSEFAQLNYEIGSSVTIYNTAMQGWSGFYGGAGNSSAYPMFLDLDGADNIIGTADDDVRIERRSLCIDFGDAPNFLPLDIHDIDEDGDTSEFLPLDVNGNPRIVDCLDIGAAEYDGIDQTLLPFGCDGSSPTACFSVVTPSPNYVGPTSAAGLSADGLRALVGSPNRGYVRTVSGLGNLGSLGGAVTDARDISADGSTLVGVALLPNGAYRPYRWTDCEGIVEIGPLPAGWTAGIATSVSADGSVIVGYGTHASGTEAFVWTEASGIVGLGDLAGGAFDSMATGVSGDGTVVVGRGTSADGFQAFRWTQAEGMVALENLPGGEGVSIAHAISADGSTIVGECQGPWGTEAVRWVNSEVQGLGFLTLGPSSAVAVSDDGHVILGTSGGEPFYWAFGQMRRFRHMLLFKYELSTGAGAWIFDAHDLSSDGRTIVGTRAVWDIPPGPSEGWIVHIPDLPLPCPADVDGSDTVDVSDLLFIINNWGDFGPFVTDVDGDDMVGIGDLLELISVWGSCP